MSAYSRVRTLTACWLILGMFAAATQAQGPSIFTTSPQAVKPGTTVDVTICGGNLAGATQLWTSFPCQAVLSPDVKDNAKNNGEAIYRITIPEDAPIGVHGIRVVTPGGISALKLFAIDDLSSVAQQGNNNTPSTAQTLALPVAVDGAMASLKSDYYKFKAEAGQRLSIEILAQRIGSPLDLLIQLLDARGRILTSIDDEPGLSSDPRLSYTFAESGEYTLKVRDNQWRGGENYFYRLRIGDFPCVTVPYPMGAKRGSDVTIGFAGPDVQEVQPVTLKVPSDPLLNWINVSVKRTGGQSSSFAILATGDGEEFLETEPNDAAEKANRVNQSTNLNGRLDNPGDVDRFVFHAKKGQKFLFAAIARSQGSPADLSLQLFKAEGQEVAKSDDSGQNEATVNYTLPADGDYSLVVYDLARKGGSAYAYRIEVTQPKPGFSLSATADRLNIPAGGIAAVTVNATRNNYNGPIAVAAIDLPKGVTSLPTIIGPGRTHVILTVKSASNALAGRLFPIRIVGTAKIGNADFQATASIIAALKGVLNGMPYPPRILAKSTALAIGPKPPFVLRTEPAQVVFGRNLKATVKVIAERQTGYDEEIVLAVTPARKGLPPGITVAVKPIPKGKNEIEVIFSADEKAPLSEFTANLIGKHKKEKTTTEQSLPGVGLKLEAPLRMTVSLAEGPLKQGSQIKVKATVQRNPALSAPIVVTFQNLPKGVSAPATTIPVDKNEVDILLSAAQNALVSTVKNITIQGEASVGKMKLSAISSAVALTVE